MVIRVTELTPAADTGDDGLKLYMVLAARVASRRQTVVSFAGIRTATSSFVNSAFVPLLDLAEIEDIKSLLRVVDSTSQINDMIKSRLEVESRRVTPKTRRIQSVELRPA